MENELAKLISPTKWWQERTKEEKEAILERGRVNKKEESMFVVFGVSERQWQEFYSKGSYCNMGKTEKGTMVGTVMARKNFDERVSPFSREMNDEEMRQYQLWAEAYNVYPRPFSVG
jgi:hypothetical protein